MTEREVALEAELKAARLEVKLIHAARVELGVVSAIKLVDSQKNN